MEQVKPSDIIFALKLPHTRTSRFVYIGIVNRILILIAVAASAIAQPKTPVIVELFTSEGCSSCPPADNILTRLTHAFPDIDVVPLSEHVDYWNYLGWTDRFSSPLFSERQQDYGRMFRLESVYTPQMVVNGEAQFSGTDEGRARQEIARAVNGPKANAQLAIVAPDVMKVSVDHIPQGVRNADVFLAITESGLETVPNKGENSGVRLRFTGVVRSLTSLSHIDTRKQMNYVANAKMNLDNAWHRDRVTYVMFVQDRSSRRIIGAATLRPSN